MKKEEMKLTYEQARDLKWFCQNVAGVRADFYKVFEAANGFEARLMSLEKTCATIEKYFGEKIEAFSSPFDEETK